MVEAFEDVRYAYYLHGGIAGPQAVDASLVPVGALEHTGGGDSARFEFTQQGVVGGGVERRRAGEHAVIAGIAHACLCRTEITRCGQLRTVAGGQCTGGHVGNQGTHAATFVLAVGKAVVCVDCGIVCYDNGTHQLDHAGRAIAALAACAALAALTACAALATST